jgi:hypothetical protein
MVTLILVYYSGLIITNEIDIYEFIGMKKETFLLNEFPPLENLVGLVREWLVEWMRVLISVSKVELISGRAMTLR